MLLTPEQFFGFLAFAVPITIAPGPDNLMVLSIGISRGRKQGMAFGLGCALGCLSHTLLAALGISALIAASPIAFAALKIAGGLYLIYLGFGAIRSRGIGDSGKLKSSTQPDESLLKLFSKGLIANSINPKVVLFFLSFLPQFVLAQNGQIAWQTAQLGIIFTTQGVILFSLLGYFSGAVGQWLNRRPTAGLWLDRIAGGIFIALGLRLVFAR
jgi:threonine/homoserine/homoserine lactone efflux protein